MSSYRPVDSKREEFRKYLERSGVMDALTKVLVALYEEPEKPADALEYVSKHLGEAAGVVFQSEKVKSLEEKVKFYEDKVNKYKIRLANYESVSDDEEGDGNLQSPPGAQVGQVEDTEKVVSEEASSPASPSKDDSPETQESSSVDAQKPETQN